MKHRKSVFRSEDGRAVIQDRYREILKKWPVPSGQRFIETAAGTTHTILSGDESAEPLLLLHGTSGNSAGWMGDAALWSSSFRVIAADMPGEPGLSEDRRLNPATDEYGRWIGSLLDGLGIGSVSIIGMSLGGFGALKFASSRPGRVKKLVLLAPSGIGPARISFLFKALPLMAAGERGSDRINRIAAYKTPLPPEVLEFGRLVSKHFRPLTSPVPILSDEELQRLKMPVLYFGGDRDALLDSAAAAYRLRKLDPGARTVLLPDTGHIILGQTEKIMEFLEKQ